ncbi:MAG: hypothetical protein ABSA76_04175 [Bacteroidales bacterium]
MYQRDFILRMIEMVRELIMGILGLIKKGELDKADEGIEKIYAGFLREDSSFFIAIPKEELTQKLLRGHNYNNGHLEILAMLFYAEAELELDRGKKKESLEFSQKALILFEFIDNEQKTYSFENEEKISLLRKRIDSLNAGKI